MDQLSFYLDQACLEGGQGTNFVLDYVYQHLQEFKLIFCCSAGTEYEDYLDRLGEIEESYYLEFVRKYGQDSYFLLLFEYFLNKYSSNHQQRHPQ